MTTTITVTFRGKPEDLKNANVFAIHSASRRHLVGDRLTAIYVCETDDYDTAMDRVHDAIDVDQVERFHCELVSIG